MNLACLLLVASAAAECPEHLAAKKDAYTGQCFTFMLPAHDNLQSVVERAIEFYNCTGGEVKIHKVSYSNWNTELKLDLGTKSDSGASVFDAFMIKSAWFAEFAEIGALESLSKFIKRDLNLDWTDVFPVIRQHLVTYNDEAYVLPNDADFVMMYWRMDLLLSTQKGSQSYKIPTTWEQLIAVAEYFHGQDLNDDGVPDYGICWPGNPFNFGMIAMSIHASVLQARGVHEGVFFDTESGEPLWENAASKYAFEVLQRLFALSPFAQHGPNYHNFKGHAKDFMQGRCSVLVGMPGLFKTVMHSGGVRRVDVDGKLIWQPSEQPKHARMVGSTRVLDRSTGTLVDCTREICPFAAGSPLINRPTFFGSGGFASAIATSAPEDVKQMAFDFLSYLMGPQQSLQDVTKKNFFDPYRGSHVSAAASQAYEANGWTVLDASRLFEIEREALMGQVESSAMDLRIPGRDDFIFETSQPSTRSENYLTPKGWESLTYLYLGWVLAPDDTWVQTPPISVDELMARLQDSWAEHTDEQGGKLSMLRSYRASLSLPPLSSRQLCEHHRAAFEAEGGDCRKSDIASTGQQRVYWTLSTVVHTVGLFLSAFVLTEFYYNKTLRAPNVMATSLLAISVPDFCHSLLFFMLCFVNLLRGHELEEGPCKAVAVVTYMVVIATFCGPITVAFVTWYKLSRVGGGAWQLSPFVLSGMIVSPWLLGGIAAALVHSQGYLGSYRGMYCYNTDRGRTATGGVTLVVFGISTAITCIFYLLTAYSVYGTYTKANSNKVKAREATNAIARRGSFLVLCYFCVWVLFAAVGILHPSIPLETAAALIAALPAIVDSIMILSLPMVRLDLLQRLTDRFSDIRYTRSSDIAVVSSSTDCYTNKIPEVKTARSELSEASMTSMQETHASKDHGGNGLQGA